MKSYSISHLISHTEIRNQLAWEVENEDKVPYVGTQECLNFCLFLSWI